MAWKSERRTGSWQAKNPYSDTATTETGERKFQQKRNPNLLKEPLSGDFATAPPGRLRGLFRDQRVSSLLRLEVRNLHLLPVVAEFPAAIQAHHVRPCADRRGAAGVRPHRDWKTVTRVPAPKYRIDHLRKHRITFFPRTIVKTSLGFISLFSYLDSFSAKKVRT
jgi:hypothetical protein